MASLSRERIEQMPHFMLHEDYAVLEAINLVGRTDVHVLDVGCVDGLGTVLRFAPYSAIACVVGIDQELGELNELVQRADDVRFSFLCTTFEDFAEQKENCFDIVYFNQTLRYAEDPQAALEKAYKLLTPGGFVVVKTLDVGLELSYPDPDKVAHRLFTFCERSISPKAVRGANRDCYQGRKSYTFMKRAGFSNVCIRTFLTDTAEKTLDERRMIPEQCLFFQQEACGSLNAAAAIEHQTLLAEWRSLLEQEDYYFASQTFAVLGQKVTSQDQRWSYGGSIFGCRVSLDANSRDYCAEGSTKGVLVPLLSRFSDKPGFSTTSLNLLDSTQKDVIIRPMIEDDLSHIMKIEIASFKDPWTPLAFVLDLRHNPCARYRVVVARGDVVGYLGWWNTPEGAVIVRVAVEASFRKGGAGRLLIEALDREARCEGCKDIVLEVRASNTGARTFYLRMGFEEVSVRASYYDSPVDDAVVMARAL